MNDAVVAGQQKTVSAGSQRLRLIHGTAVFLAFDQRFAVGRHEGNTADRLVAFRNADNFIDRIRQTPMISGGVGFLVFAEMKQQHRLAGGIDNKRSAQGEEPDQHNPDDDGQQVEKSLGQLQQCGRSR